MIIQLRHNNNGNTNIPPQNQISSIISTATKASHAAYCTCSSLRGPGRSQLKLIVKPQYSDLNK